MKIKVIISGGGHDSEHEMDLSKVYNAELNLILVSLKTSVEGSGKRDTSKITMASIIPGLISIGIDTAIKTYGMIRVKRITKQFIDDCLGWK